MNEGITFYFDWEVKLIIWLQTVLPGAVLSVLSFCSVFGEEKLLIAVVGLIYWGIDKKLGIYITENMVVAATSSSMIKNTFFRRRPYFDNPDIKCLRIVKKDRYIYDAAAQGFSFPSIHSCNSVTMFGTLGRYSSRRIFKILGFVIPLLVGISRVSMGVHFPTDVLAGWTMGIVVILVLPVIREKIKDRRIYSLVLILIYSTGFLYCKSEDYFTGFGLMTGNLLAIMFEEKYVKFQNTTSWIKRLARLAGGMIIFVLLSAGLKLPFSREFLESVSLASHIVRTLRYAITGFTGFGLYPMLFMAVERRIEGSRK